MVVAGTAGTVATSPATADISGVSESVRVVLDEGLSTESFEATVSLVSDVPVASGTGLIGMTVTLDSEAEGSLQFTLTSQTSGETQGGDIVDTQAQGQLRIGIDAFNGCRESCEEELSIEFVRTDDPVSGTLGLTFSLDGIASTESESDGSASIDFAID